MEVQQIQYLDTDVDSLEDLYGVHGAPGIIDQSTRTKKEETEIESVRQCQQDIEDRPSRLPIAIPLPPGLDLTPCKLTPEQIRQLHVIINKYDDIFAKPGEPLGVTSRVEHTIEVETEKPAKQPMYRSALAQRKQITAIIEEMQEAGAVIL